MDLKERKFQKYLKSAIEMLKHRMNPVNGIGTIKDEEKAFQFYFKSAEGGN
ncbi:hypothetical protein Glove_194g97 [Diversispora epigaea]|uniref:Uncharacterized protein n=1 Tax=Diversispora epigaea TaxID=1348612 RepID=A0A397IU68_9GLOM|nr:hypothetical protein Glove_194g97 [Diversispora epigaea]